MKYEFVWSTRSSRMRKLIRKFHIKPIGLNKKQKNTYVELTLMRGKINENVKSILTFQPNDNAQPCTLSVTEQKKI